MSYSNQLQVPYPTYKEGYYPYVAQAPLSNGQQLDCSMQLLAKSTEETKAIEATLLASFKNCEEQEKVLNEQMKKIQQQKANLHTERMQLAKGLTPIVATANESTLGNTLKSTGKIIKDNWKPALLIAIVAGGIFYVMANSNESPRSGCRYC